MSSKTWEDFAVCFSSRASYAHVSSHSPLGQIVSPHNPFGNFERKTDCQQSTETIASWWSGWSAPLHLHRSSRLRVKLERFIYPSVNYLSSGTYWPIRYSVAGLKESLKTARRACRRFFFVSPPSPLGHTTTLSRFPLFIASYADALWARNIAWRAQRASA